MTLRMHVDESRCQGHARCHMEAPEVFGHDEEDGKAIVSDPVVPRALDARVRRAAASCPERAIHLVEEADSP